MRLRQGHGPTLPPGCGAHHLLAIAWVTESFGIVWQLDRPAKAAAFLSEFDARVAQGQTQRRMAQLMVGHAPGSWRTHLVALSTEQGLRQSLPT